jgi:hypothetical protein
MAKRCSPPVGGSIPFIECRFDRPMKSSPCRGTVLRGTIPGVIRAGRLTGVSAVALLVLAAGAFAASPRVGNWEASGTVRASFAVVRSGRGWKLEDFVFAGSQRCRSVGATPGTFALPQEVVPVKPDGQVSWSTKEVIATFPSGRLVVVGRTALHGTFTTAKLAHLTFSHMNYPPPGAPKNTPECRIPPTTFTAHAARRLAVRDGAWRGIATNGEPVFFEVLANGRAISSAMPVPSSPFPDLFVSFAFGQGCSTAHHATTCASTDPAKADGGAVDPCLHGTSTNALISPDRSASIIGLQDFALPSFYGPALASVTIRFTGPRSARGSYTQPGDPSCSSTFAATTP